LATLSDGVIILKKGSNVVHEGAPGGCRILDRCYNWVMHKYKGWKTLARVLFGLPFGVFGLLHFMAGPQMAVMVPGIFPGSGAMWVYLAGIVLLAGSLSLLFNKYVMYGAGALAALMLIFVLTIHIPGVMNEASRQIAMPGLLKDTALMGGALMFALRACGCNKCASGNGGCQCGPGGCSCG